MKPSREFIIEVMQSKIVRDRLAVDADVLAIKTQRALDADKSGPAVTLVREDGTRPLGRPFSRVTLEGGAAQEFGTSKTARRRILGQVVESSSTGSKRKPAMTRDERNAARRAAYAARPAGWKN